MVKFALQHYGERYGHFVKNVKKRMLAVPDTEERKEVTHSHSPLTTC